MADASLNKKKVVIIGYGVAGTELAPILAKDKKLSVTVVTPFDFEEICVKMTKLIPSPPEEQSKNLTPLLREDNVEYVIGKAISITDNSVTLQSGQIVNFDIGVIATGNKVPLFQMDPDVNTIDARKAQLSDVYSNILKANTVVISGGGAIGSELAADLKLRHTNKRVILVTTEPKILTRMHPTLSDLATKAIQNQGVELFVSDRVEEFKDGTVKLQSGRTIIADMYIPAHAISPNSSFMPAEALDAKGFIKVDDNLKVIGYQNLFALGDVSDRDPVKAFIRVKDQLPTIVNNVQAKAGNGTMKPHVKGGTFFGKIQGPMLVALGHDLKNGYGVGPDLPGFMSYCVWFCCCGPPAGKQSNKIKSDFNNSITHKKGKGISD